VENAAYLLLGILVGHCEIGEEVLVHERLDNGGRGNRRFVNVIVIWQKQRA